MSATEEVIKGLEYCRQHGRLSGKDCSAIFTYTNYGRDIVKINEYRHDCPYGKCKTGCVVTLVDDALATLKEQEEQVISVDTKVIGTEHGDIEVYCCRACRYQLDLAFHFCPNCGKKVKWE